MKLRYLLPALALSLALLPDRLHAQYCSAGLYLNGCEDGDYIASFSTTGGGSNINNISAGCNSVNSYTYFGGQLHSAAVGATVGYSITNNPDYAETYFMWVDWNGDFDFEDAGEAVYVAEIADGGTTTGSFVIPAGTTPGLKRLRLRAVYDTSGGVTACSEAGYGEAEDYNLEVTSAVACSGTPEAGMAVAGDTTLCAGAPFVPFLSGYTAAPGIAIQWQQAAIGSNAWANIPGATMPVYNGGPFSAAAQYRAYLVCSGSGGSDTSAPVAISQGVICYCSPLNGNTLIGVDSYNDLVNVSIAGTPLNVSTNSTPYPDGYVQIDPTAAASNTATLAAGNTYTLNATFYGPYVGSIGLWIDYNRSGSFESVEFIPMTIAAGGESASATFTVPDTAQGGEAGMRLMVSDIGDGQPVTASGACSNIVAGEVEDYTLDLTGGAVPSTPCDTPMSISAGSITAGSAILSWSGPAGATGYEYAVTTGSTPPTTGTPVATSPVSAGSLTANTLYYAHIRTQCDTAHSAWVTTSFTTLSSTGIGSLAAMGISVVPNPTHHEVRIVATGLRGPATLSLTDITGSALLRRTVDSEITTLDLRAIAPGIYFLRLTTGEGDRVIKLEKQ